MVYREVHRVELRELIRRWQAGQSGRKIASGLGIARNTVDKYLKAAERLGLSVGGPEPTDDQLQELLKRGSPVSASRGAGASESLLVSYQPQLEAWLQQEQLQLTRVQELLAQRGCIVPYTSLRRFVAKQGLGPGPKSTVRLPETKPGQYAEFDFGRLGQLADGSTKRRVVVWALVVVLSFSRHMFVWPLVHQRLADIVEGLEATWRFFGGIPKYLILDNCPAAIAGPDPLTPKLTVGFLEYAQHRGFIPDPTRTRHPQDKPHVERGVPYVRERLFKGGSFLDLHDLRSQALHWCLEVAGQRVHGTTRQLPLVVFRDQEQQSLLPFDAKPYAVPSWGRVQVHLDHHVAYQYALYSVPWSLCPPKSSVEVCADDQLVRIYHRGNLVKTHPRQERGGRSTDPSDYPPAKSSYAQREPGRLCKLAQELGPSVGEFASRLLSDAEDGGPWARFRQAEKLLRLGQRYTPARLELACARALRFELIDVRRLERILREAIASEEGEEGEEGEFDAGGADAESVAQAQADGDPAGHHAATGERVEAAGAARVTSTPTSARSQARASTLSARFARPGSAFARSTDSTDSTDSTGALANGEAAAQTRTADPVLQCSDPVLQR